MVFLAQDEYRQGCKEYLSAQDTEEECGWRTIRDDAVETTYCKPGQQEGDGCQ